MYGGRGAAYSRHMSKRTTDTLMLAAAAALAGAAVAKELGQPPGDRTWHGRILGLPYDFRPPTAARLRHSFWAPESDALLIPHAFGIGYSVNLARVTRPAREAWAARAGQDRAGASAATGSDWENDDSSEFPGD